MAKPFAEVGVWSEPDATVLSVADNGPGVPTALRTAVFREGWSTKRARRTAAGGSVSRS